MPSMFPAWSAIDPEQANHVLAHFGEGGYRAGSFTMLLLLAIAAADPINRAKLSQGFPGYVAAMELAQLDADGLDLLRDIAAGGSVDA